MTAEMEGTAKTSRLFPESDLGLMITPKTPVKDGALWIAENRQSIEQLHKRHPVLVFRDVGVENEGSFQAVRNVLVGQPVDYVYRSTPRTEVLDGIMTATEYPASEEILMHCENAYQREWPMQLIFCCLIPAQTGGQTPVADVRRVSRAIGDALLDKVEKRGIRYVRNYHSGVDLDWRTVFQANNKQDVEAFCRANDIHFSWHGDGHLTTWQICQGTARHPRTSERLWFNQAHLFHPSALGADAHADMLDLFGEDGLPRNAQYGDGEPIEPELLEKVRAAFAAEAQQFDWKGGDVMLLDNMLASHARRPFTGSRRVLVSMGRMSKAAWDVSTSTNINS
jgi:alpha-ketoglutarate-dependent taurine dioxygenase